MKQLQHFNHIDELLFISQKYKKQKVDGIKLNSLPNIPINWQHFEFSLALSETDFISSDEQLTDFTIQSISKFLILYFILSYFGEKEVLKRIQINPTDVVYNEKNQHIFIQKNKIVSPFINAGAISLTSMIPGDTTEKKVNHIKHFIQDLFKIDFSIDEKTYLHEKRYSDSNYKICLALNENNFLDSDIKLSIDTYLQLCSIKMNTQKLAKIGYLFTKILETKNSNATLVDLAMKYCGLYNESPLQINKEYIAAKSGVSGAILTYSSFPCHYNCNLDKIGLGIYSPLLNKNGNSTKAYSFLQYFYKSLLEQEDFYGI